jgi:hypothetical protein
VLKCQTLIFSFSEVRPHFSLIEPLSFQLLREGIIKKLSGVLASIRAILNAPVRTLQAEDSE